MKYDLRDIALIYAKGFNEFLNSVKVLSKDEAYLLFSYSIKKLYDLETSEYNDVIGMYGERCVDFLSQLDGVPKRKDKLSFKDRCAVIDFSRGYWVASDVIREA